MRAVIAAATMQCHIERGESVKVMRREQYKKLLRDIVDGKDKALDSAFGIFYGKCRYCGKHFKKTRPDQEFCSATCRVKKSQEKKKDGTR